MNTVRLVGGLRRLPGVRWLLRRLARAYRDGSVTTIRWGGAAGLRFKRFHRYVSAYHLGIHEIRLQEAIARELHEGDVFYDIGANAGFFSIIAARLAGPEGHCYAFEPLPENIAALHAQVEVNNLRNCTVVEAAVSESEGATELVQHAGSQTPRISAVAARSEGKHFTVRMITLDAFAKAHRIPDCVKIDVEGAELLVLRGMAELLASPEPPKLIVEIHNAAVDGPVREMLTGCGYHLYDLERSSAPDASSFPYHMLADPPRASGHP